MSADGRAAPRLLDEEALREWGRRLGAAAARERVFVALFGPLGAGKSTLVRAAARGAGVEGAVPSPTYTLVNEHPLPGEDGGTLFHVDLYRLSGPRALDEIGWDRLLAGEGPVFVEWADRAEGALPADRWEVRLDTPEDRSLRRVAVRRAGAAPRPPELPGTPPGSGADAAPGETADAATGGDGSGRGQPPC